MKHIMITGASRGLGRALALRLASLDYNVSLVGRRRGPLEDVAASLRGRALALPFDVADKEAIHRIVGEAAAVFGPVDALVNNASTLGPWGEATPSKPMPLLLDTDCEDLEAVLQTNLVGPFRLAKAVLGSMVLRGKGTVLNISSDAATSAYPGWGAYGTSKAALEHLSRIWNAELEGTGVSVWSADPGEMDTLMHAAALPDADRSTLARPEDVAKRLADELVRRL